MIWRGQIKAILSIIVVVGLGISVAIYNATESVWPFFLLLGLVVVASVGLGVFNTLSAAFTGKPLVYDVKIMQNDDPTSGPRSSADGFCMKCGAAQGARAQFCINCGTRRTPATAS